MNSYKIINGRKVPGRCRSAFRMPSNENLHKKISQRHMRITESISKRSNFVENNSHRYKIKFLGVQKTRNNQNKIEVSNWKKVTRNSGLSLED